MPINSDLGSRMAALEAKYASHEVLCTERWIAARKTQQETQEDVKSIMADVRSLLSGQANAAGTLRGALFVSRILWVATGAAVASMAWLIKTFALMR